MVMRYFELECKPHGKARPRARVIKVIKDGRAVYMPSMYTTKEDKDYEKQVRDAYLATYDRIPPMECPVTVRIECFMPVPSGATRKTKREIENGDILPCNKPDIDNIAKSVLDALNGVAWSDDKNVVGLYVQKHFETHDYKQGIRVYIKSANQKESEDERG